MTAEEYAKEYYHLDKVNIESLSIKSATRFAERYAEEKLKSQSLEIERLKSIVLYQLCPKCNGQGQVSKPPYIAGDVHKWTSSSSIFTCDVCNGSKIIPMFINKQH
jgi:hypothetical protein